MSLADELVAASLGYTEARLNEFRDATLTDARRFATAAGLPEFIDPGSVARHLEEARRALSEASDHLARRDFDTASRRFASALRSVEQAAGVVGGRSLLDLLEAGIRWEDVTAAGFGRQLGLPAAVPGLTREGGALAYTISAPRTAVVDEPPLRLAFDRAALIARLALDGGSPPLSVALALTGFEVGIGGGPIASLLGGAPAGLRADEVAFAVDPANGLTLGGGASRRIALPARKTSGLLDLREVRVELSRDPPGGIDIRATAATRIGGVLAATLHGVGLRVDAGDPDDPLAVSARPPAAIGLSLDAAILSARGEVLARGETSYAGGLAVQLPPLAASALATLELQPVSFAAIIAASFPPPGIQIGFGFAVTGVGGVLGVDRRVDRDALLRAAADGSLAQLLFPRAPVAGAEVALRALDAIFPPAPGSFVAGPMVEFAWGSGQLVTGAAAVVLELGRTTRVSILGKLGLALPSPRLPLISLQATFAGHVDPAEPSVSFLVGVSGRIIGIPLSGDVFLLARGGREATFVLSAGGFHPRFAVPRGIPPLRRLALELSASSAVRLRCEAYLAITSNTVQFGGRVELVAAVAGCGLRGHLQLDVLVQFRPQLQFAADVSVAIAVRVAGRNLVGIHLQLSLEGPTQWRARGRGRVELFFLSIPFEFDTSWGTPHPLDGARPDVAAALARAFEPAASWLVHRPAGAPAGVRLAPEAERALGRGEIMDPFGSLTARQRVVPLDECIDRFGRLPLGRPGTRERWEIVGFGFGTAPAGTPFEVVEDQFAPAEFQTLTDDQQLGQPAFRSFHSGARFAEARVVMDPRSDRVADVEFEELVVAGERPERVALESDPFEAPRLGLRVVEAMAAAAHPAHHDRWRPPASAVVVDDAPRSVVAASWSLAEPLVGGTSAFEEATSAVLDELAGDPGVTVVEAWEVLA